MYLVDMCMYTCIQVIINILAPIEFKHYHFTISLPDERIFEIERMVSNYFCSCIKNVTEEVWDKAIVTRIHACTHTHTHVYTYTCVY